MNETVFNATFWLSIVGVLGATMGLIFTAINKSKCSNIKLCWGCFECIRNTEAEVELEEVKIEAGIPDTPK